MKCQSVEISTIDGKDHQPGTTKDPSTSPVRLLATLRLLRTADIRQNTTRVIMDDWTLTWW